MAENQKPPVFKPEQATEVGVLAQLESTVDNNPPKIRNDGGKYSGGRLHIYAPNIDEDLKEQEGRASVSQELLDDWDASWSYTGPGGVQDEQNRIIERYPNDITNLGAYHMNKVQQNDARYGYSSSVPRIMSWNNPAVTQRAILHLTGIEDFAKQKPDPSLRERDSKGKIVIHDGREKANVVNGAWTVYVNSVGSPLEAEKNLLKQIQTERVNSLPEINKERKRLKQKPFDSVQDDYIWQRAERILTEPFAVGNTKKTLVEALQDPNLDPALLPLDMQHLFQETSPNIRSVPDPKAQAAEALETNRQENAIMIAEREGGLPVDDISYTVGKLWNQIMTADGRSKAEFARLGARLGLAKFGIGPDDIPNYIETNEVIKILFGNLDLPPGSLGFSPDSSQPLVPQILEYVSQFPQALENIKFEATKVLMGEVVSPTNWLGGLLYRKTGEHFAVKKFADEIAAAKVKVNRLRAKMSGTDIQGVHEQYMEKLKELKNIGPELRKRAETLMENNPLFFEEVKALLPNQALNDAQIFSVGVRILDSADDLIKYVKEMGPAAFSDAEMAKDFTIVLKRLTRDLIAPYKASKGTAGRTLESLDDVDNKTADAMAEQFMNIIKTATTPQAAALQLSMFDNSLELAQVIKTVTRPGWHEMYNEVLINGFLSGPSTLLVINPMGNSVAMFSTIAQRQLAGLFGQGGVPMGEAARMTYGLFAATGDAFRTSWKVARSGAKEINVMVRGEATKLDINRFASIRGEHFDGVPNWFKTGIDWFGAFTRFPSRMMLAMDEGTKVAFYSAELTAQAGRKALQRPGFNTMSWADQSAQRRYILDDMRRNPHLHMDAHKVSNITAHANTFTSPGGESMEAMSKLVNSHPLLKTLFPFIRTPANIMKRIGSDAGWGARSQAVQAIRKFKDLEVKLLEAQKLNTAGGAELVKNIHGSMQAAKAARDEALGRITFATTTAGIFAAMTTSGVFVGGRGPNDGTLRRQQREQLGKEQGAFAFDTDGDGLADRYVPVNMRHPLGIVLNTVGSLTEAAAFLHIGSEKEAELGEAATEAIMSLVDIIGEAPFLDSIGDMMQMLKSYEDSGWDGVKGHIAKTGATYMMPLYVGARNQISRAVDTGKHDLTADYSMTKVLDLVKVANTIIDGIKSTIPGLSEDMLADRSVLTGKQIQYPSGAGPGSFADNDVVAGLINVMNPLFPVSAKISPVYTKKEIKVAQWMANNDVSLPNPPRKLEGVVIPNNLYQQWKALIGSGDLINSKTGEVLLENIMGISMLDRAEGVIDTGNSTPVYNKSTGKTTTLQKTQFSEAYTQQKDVALQFLLSTPDWQVVQQQVLNRQVTLPAQESPSNTISRVPKGIHFSF